MTSDANEQIRLLFEQLTGQKQNAPAQLTTTAIEVLEHGSGWGYSQFNEILLLLGYDRVCAEFFQYVVDQTTDYKPSAALRSIDHLRQAVDRFRKLGLLLFGNVKYAFKRFRTDPDELNLWLDALSPRSVESYKSRHDPIQPIVDIGPRDTYLLGYIVEQQLRRRLEARPDDEDARELEERRASVVAQGVRNQSAYLVSDHLDVYVATSMREQHEYLLVSQFCRQLFSHPALAPLKLRWFDPTQAYCRDRIDKGLAEALMLKRAKCTIYLVQETDTLGKDSELASTLAQGKPVIAFVPSADEDYVTRLIDAVRTPEASDADVMLKLLRLFRPTAAWESEAVRRWLSVPGSALDELDALRAELVRSVVEHYDRRAETLKNHHPLGIQVNLATGVANGVLVVRNEEDCAALVHGIVTSTLDFSIDEAQIGGATYVLLREKISGCVFRVMTGDVQLSNAFWNFYLQASS